MADNLDFSGLSDEELDRVIESGGTWTPPSREPAPAQVSPQAQEEPHRYVDSNGNAVYGDSLLEEGVKGAGRAVKAIGGGIVGLGSGAVRLAGTPVRALTGWDGLHRVADAIDSGYEDWGSEALASELPDDDWGRVLGGFGEKIAGTAGSLAALGAGGKIASAAGAALKTAGHAKTAAVAANALPLMFGNDAAVRTYDTAKENGSGTARALGLASVNGAIHYFGFKAFENQSLNKMLGMPQEMTAMMPGWANAARDGGARTFTELASGVRNGMFKYILAERAKGALKAGGIMGLQNFLSSVPTQMAEGAGVGDVDWGRAVSEGVGGVEEGALMEGLMGGAAMLKTPKAARKFIADTYFRKGYDLPNGQHVPGLLHSEEGRAFVMKQNQAMQARVLDIVEHGGKVTKGELNAACLPPDMTEAELREFAKDWRRDIDAYTEEAWNADNPSAANRAPGADVEMRDANAAEGERRLLSAEEAEAQQREIDTERAVDEAWNADDPNRPAPPIDAAEPSKYTPLSAEEAEAQREAAKSADEQRVQQQPKEVTNETGNVPVEAQPEPPVQDAGRDGQQQAPQAADGSVEGEAPRGEVPAAGEVAEARPAEAKPVAPAPAATDAKPAEPNPVSKSDKGGQKLTGGAKEEATPPATQAEPPAAEPAKNAPASAPRTEGTTTPPQSADAPQGAESAAGGATGGAAEEPKPTQGNKLRSGTTLNTSNGLSKLEKPIRDIVSFMESDAHLFTTSGRSSFLEKMRNTWRDAISKLNDKALKTLADKVSSGRYYKGAKDEYVIKAIEEVTRSVADERFGTQTASGTQTKSAPKLRTQAEADAAPQADAAPAAPATQEATPEASTTPAPTVAEQTQPASKFRDKNGEMKKTLRGAVERIASAIGNRTGKGTITPEEADAIVNGIAESPEAKHNRTRQFFTPLVTDAEWQNSLGVDAESAKNLRDAVERASDASQRKKKQRKLDNALRAADAGDKDAPTAYGLVRIASDALDKARTKGDRAAEARAQKALDDANAKFNAEYEQVPEANRERWVKEQEKQFEEWSKKHDDVARNESVTADAPIQGNDGSSTTMAEQLPAKSTNRVGGRYAKGYVGEIKGVDGDEVHIAYYDADGKFMREEKVPLSTLRERGKVLKQYKELADVVEAKGEDAESTSVRFERAAPESHASRDAKFAVDADYQRWLKSRKANDAEPLRQRYEMEQAKALGDAYQNAVRGVDFEYVDRDYDPAKDNPNGGRELKDRDTGTVLGIFDRDTGKLKLFRGASWKTLNHELGGHATMRLAEQEAARGNRALLDKINEAIDGAMDTPLADDVRRRYPDADEATLRDEIWAALRERPSEAMQKYVKTLQGRKWYNRAWDAIKTAWRGILSRMGFNRADLSGIDKMTPDEFNEFLDKAMIGGKTLGRLETQGGEGIGNKLRKAFGGGLARVLPGNIGRYREAKQMEADGASREDIWCKTGWWKGKDGKWRVELPDIKISNEKAEWLRNHARVYPDEPVSLESLIEAPELFRVYPSLKKIKVYASADRDIYGSQILDRIYLNRDLRVDKYRTVLAHEIQHVIQDFENFAKGGNLEDAKRLVEQRHPLLIKARDELVAIAKKSGYEDWAMGLSPEERRSISNQLFGMTSERIPLLASYINGGYRERPDYAKKMPEVNRMITKLREAYNAYKGAMVDAEAKDQSRNITPTKIYNAFSGEVEARNVESRLDMTPEERASRPPWETEDVPESEQIVRTGDGGGASESRDGRKSSVRMARGPAAPGANIMDDKRTTGEKMRERFFNSDAPMKDLQDEVPDVREVIRNADGYTDWEKSTDVVAAKQKAQGRLEHETRQLQRGVDSMVKDLNAARLDGQTSGELLDDLNLYAQCKHAKERNETIAQRNGVAYDADYYYGMGKITLPGGKKIGLSEDVANRLIKGLDGKYGKSRFASLEEARKKLVEIGRDDIRRRLESGKLSAADANYYLYHWNDYVPLKTDIEKIEPGLLNSSTAGPKRNEFMKAFGRANADIADSPVAAMLLQAEQGIRGSIRNELANVLANFVEHAEAKGLHVGEIVEGIDEAHFGKDFVFTFSDADHVKANAGMQMADKREDIQLYKRDGKLYAIRMDKGANGRGLDVMKSFKGDNVESWGDGILSKVPKFTHWMSAMRTQYSPEFTISNYLADSLEAAQALMGRYGVWDGAKAFGKSVAAQIRNAKDVWKYVRTGELNGDVKKAVEAGLLTKGGVASEGFEAKEGDVRLRLDQLRRKADGFWKLGAADKAKWIWENGMDFIAAANELMEYSTRIGLFSALHQGGKGVPVNEAVKFAREATVDFNRKGTFMPIINGLYMFANASVQGAARAVQAGKESFQDLPNDGSGYGRHKFKGDLVALLVGVGAAKAVIDYFCGNDDEREKAGGRNARNMTEYDKKHNVGIPIGGGRQVPLLRFRGPYAALPYLAQTTMNVILGETKPGDAASAIPRELTDQLTDLVGGNGMINDKGELDWNLAAQSLAPSAIDPIIQLASGKDYKGADRKRRTFDKTQPVSHNGKPNTPWSYKAFAEAVNALTDGNSLRKGKIDIAPEDAQLVWEFIWGGLGRDIGNLFSTGQNIYHAVKGGNTDRLLTDAPIARRLVREYPESTGRYYDALDEYNADKAEFKKTTELGRRAELKKAHPYLTAQKGRVDALIEQVQELTHRERGEVKVGQKWVPMKTELPEERKEAFRKRRLRLQAEVLRILGK